MRAAPPVSVRCECGTGWRAVQTVLPALAAGELTYWLLARVEAPDLVWALLAAAAVAAVIWPLSRGVAGVLTWDGGRWTVVDVTGQVDVMIDLGPWLLLRLRPEGGASRRWIALSAREAGPAWHGLRAALYSRPPAAITPSVPPPERVPD